MLLRREYELHDRGDGVTIKRIAHLIGIAEYDQSISSLHAVTELVWRPLWTVQRSAFWRNSDDTIKNSEQFKRACDAIDAVAGSAITDGVFLAFIDSDIKTLREIIARTRAAGP
jgi:hypothetical protein